MSDIIEWDINAIYPPLYNVKYFTNKRHYIRTISGNKRPHDPPMLYYIADIIRGINADRMPLYISTDYGRHLIG